MQDKVDLMSQHLERAQADRTVVSLDELFSGLTADVISQYTFGESIGILNTKDYFRLPNQTKDTILSTAMQPAYFILDTMKADVVFRSMKAEKHEMAVIVDEHGGMVGIVTLFDFIEELVGTFEPCTAQNSAPSIELINAHTWQISGNLALCEIEAATGIRIAAQNHDTITGLVFHTLGMIPDEGTQNIDLEIQNMNIHITNIS